MILRKFTLFLFTVFCLVSALPPAARAQATLIHYWHFNNYGLDQYTDTIHGINADYSIHNVATTSLLYAMMPGTPTTYSTHLDSLVTPESDYDTFNARMGTPPGGALRVRNPSDMMQLLLYIPTIHYKNILLKYGVEKSNSNGMLQQVFDYSVDSGLTWRTSGLTKLSDSAKNKFHLVTVGFGADTQVNNNAKLVFRIRFLGNNSGTSGNNRFDNVTIDGDSIIVGAPTTAIEPVIPTPAYNLYPNPATGAIELTGNTVGEKTIIIYNMAGQKVMETSKTGHHFSINIATLTPGSYYVNISERNTPPQTIRFIKQ